MKLKQFISLLFISLVLINLAHNAVPHHHHSVDMHAHEGCEDHDSDISDFKTGDPCTHCHAFNGIHYFPLEIKILGNCFFSLPGDVQNTIPDDSQEINVPAGLPDHCRGTYPGVTSLRGPPSSC